MGFLITWTVSAGGFNPAIITQTENHIPKILGVQVHFTWKESLHYQPQPCTIFSPDFSLKKLPIGFALFDSTKDGYPNWPPGKLSRSSAVSSPSQSHIFYRTSAHISSSDVTSIRNLPEISATVTHSGNCFILDSLNGWNRGSDVHTVDGNQKSQGQPPFGCKKNL